MTHSQGVRSTEPVSCLREEWAFRNRVYGDASPKSRTIGVKYFEPVASIPVSNRWNLVNRPVITRIDAHVPDINLRHTRRR